MLELISASKMAAFNLKNNKGESAVIPAPETIPQNHRCRCCGIKLDGLGILINHPDTFTDHYRFPNVNVEHTHEPYACIYCAALLKSRTAMTGASGSGAVTPNDFLRLLTTEERFAFFSNPPKPPFAVCIVNATQQHVWWQAETAYNRDFFKIRFGTRLLTVDRLKALKLGQLVYAYESAEKARRHVFIPLSRNLKGPYDGLFVLGFEKNKDGEFTKEIRTLSQDIELGTLWAALEIRAGLHKNLTLPSNI